MNARRLRAGDALMASLEDALKMATVTAAAKRARAAGVDLYWPTDATPEPTFSERVAGWFK